MSLEAFASAMEKHLRKKEPPGRMIIEHLGEAIGTVNYYWEDESTRWLEAGIVIYPSRFWSRGLGTEALALWIDYLFQHLEIARVGLTTWSGNPRMVRAAEKLGMKMEGRLRKCRYYQGVYYDSIRMGILREEWGAAAGLLTADAMRPRKGARRGFFAGGFFGQLPGGTAKRNGKKHGGANCEAVLHNLLRSIIA